MTMAVMAQTMSPLTVMALSPRTVTERKAVMATGVSPESFLQVCLNDA